MGLEEFTSMKGLRQHIITNGIPALKSWGFLSEALGKLRVEGWTGLCTTILKKLKVSRMLSYS